MKTAALEANVAEPTLERKAPEDEQRALRGDRAAGGRAASGLASGALHLASVPVLPPSGGAGGAVPAVQRAKRNRKVPARKRRAQKKAERRRRRQAKAEGKPFRNAKQRRRDRQQQAQTRALNRAKNRPSRAQRREMAHQRDMEAIRRQAEEKANICRRFFLTRSRSARSIPALRFPALVDQVMTAAGLDDLTDLTTIPAALAEAIMFYRQALERAELSQPEFSRSIRREKVEKKIRFAPSPARPTSTAARRERRSRRRDEQGEVEEAATRLITEICAYDPFGIETRLGDVLLEASAITGSERPDPERFAYARGTSGDPIPITWYKAPGAYPPLTVDKSVVPRFGAFTLVDDQVSGRRRYRFGVEGSNRPRVGMSLRRTAHSSDRSEQRELNQVMNRAIDRGELEINGDPRARLSEAGGFDGDHVKDLGYGGLDSIENFWPLDAATNRAALTYNRNYLVNFLDSTGQARQAPIGVLIGKHFVVEDFYNPLVRGVPEDSGTAAAGAKGGGGLSGGKSKASRSSASQRGVVISTGFSDSETDTESSSDEF
ncbi:MAG: hypothetical protein AAGD01_16120 [Acidobacteriota bacterium]